MRRWLGLALALAACTPALASHVTEPTHPIINVELIIERYDTNEHLDCSAGWDAFPTAPASKLRISPLVNMSVSDWNTGDPSEHFSIGWQIDRRYVPNPNKPNVFAWQMEERTVWAHQNQPAHTQSHQFNAAYATVEPGQPNGGSSTNLGPGVYRFKLEVLADASLNYFVELCGFTVT